MEEPPLPRSDRAIGAMGIWGAGRRPRFRDEIDRGTGIEPMISCNGRQFQFQHPILGISGLGCQVATCFEVLLRGVMNGGSVVSIGGDGFLGPAV